MHHAKLYHAKVMLLNKSISFYPSCPQQINTRKSTADNSSTTFFSRQYELQKEVFKKLCDFFRWVCLPIPLNFGFIKRQYISKARLNSVTISDYCCSVTTKRRVKKCNRKTKKYFIYLDRNIGDADRLEMQREWVYRREVVGSKKIYNIEYNPKTPSVIKVTRK